MLNLDYMYNNNSLITPNFFRMQIHGHVIQFFVSYIEGFCNTAPPLPPSPFSHTLMYALVKVSKPLYSKK